MTTNNYEAIATKLLFIPMVLASQPSTDWLDKLKTSDQVDYWLQTYRSFYWIAKCWISRNAFQDDPLRPLLKEGRISRNQYNVIWSAETMLERLWALCQYVEPFVRERFEQANAEYPFTDAFSLFTEIAFEMVDSEFASCLKPYVNFSRTTIEKGLRYEAKAYTGERLKVPQARIAMARYQGKKTPLTSLVLRIARKTAKKEFIIESALEDYETACARLLKCLATQVHNQGGYRWINGHIVKESKRTTDVSPGS
jgi:hypothetical protein